MFLISFDIKYSLQLGKQDQGFIKALTDPRLLEVKTQSWIEFWNSIL